MPLYLAGTQQFGLAEGRLVYLAANWGLPGQPPVPKGRVPNVSLHVPRRLGPPYPPPTCPACWHLQVRAPHSAHRHGHRVQTHGSPYHTHSRTRTRRSSEGGGTAASSVGGPFEGLLSDPPRPTTTTSDHIAAAAIPNVYIPLGIPKRRQRSHGPWVTAFTAAS